MWEVFTDGGCIGNPGPGGWAYVIKGSSGQHEEYGAEHDTTNNRMELTAVIRALLKIRDLDAQAVVSVHTDSQYVKNGISQWIHKWKQNGWRTASKDPVKNQDLWMLLDSLVQGKKIDWHWVKGHAGNELNERCDALVHQGIGELK